MLLNVPCKQGKLQVSEDGMLRVMAPFNTCVWQVPCAEVTGFSSKAGAMMTVAIVIQTTHGAQYIEMVTQTNFKKLQALFPALTSNSVVGNQWYHDLRALTHIETYTNEKQMQKDVELSSHFGWMPQNIAGTAGHINVGRTATAAVLTGGFSFLLGVSRSKDTVTITFLRTPQWMAQQK